MKLHRGLGSTRQQSKSQQKQGRGRGCRVSRGWVKGGEGVRAPPSPPEHLEAGGAAQPRRTAGSVSAERGSPPAGRSGGCSSAAAGANPPPAQPGLPPGCCSCPQSAVAELCSDAGWLRGDEQWKGPQSARAAGSPARGASCRELPEKPPRRGCGTAELRTQCCPSEAAQASWKL